MTNPKLIDTELDETTKAALIQIEHDYLADIAIGYSKEEARLRRRDAIEALHLPDEESETDEPNSA